MDVVVREGVALLAIKKAASSSLKPAFGGELLESNGKRYRCFEYDRAATFVRHPLDRLVSCWADLVNRERYHYYDRFDRYGIRPRMPFPEFVRLVCELDDDIDHHIASQSSQIAGWRVEYVGLFHHLPEAWQSWAQSLPFKVGSLPHLRKSVRRANWLTYYDDELGRMAEQRYAEDLKLCRSLACPSNRTSRS